MAHRETEKIILLC